MWTNRPHHHPSSSSMKICLASRVLKTSSVTGGGGWRSLSGSVGGPVGVDDVRAGVGVRKRPRRRYPWSILMRIALISKIDHKYLLRGLLRSCNDLHQREHHRSSTATRKKSPRTLATTTAVVHRSPPWTMELHPPHRRRLPCLLGSTTTFLL